MRSLTSLRTPNIVNPPFPQGEIHRAKTGSSGRLFPVSGLLWMSLMLAMSSVAQQGAKNGEWRVYGGDAESTRYSPLDQVNRDNVKNLKIAWIWRSDNFGDGPEYKCETTPLMVNGVLYFSCGEPPVHRCRGCRNR
jgi:hypothetical protein